MDLQSPLHRCPACCLWFVSGVDGHVQQGICPFTGRAVPRRDFWPWRSARYWLLMSTTAWPRIRWAE